MTSNRKISRGKRAPRFRVWAIAAGCVALFAVVVALFLHMPGRKDASGARAALARSLTLLKLGNATAARAAALSAVRGDPDWGLAHAVLARTQLALGDGLGAEAELRRAADAGFDPERAHQMLAHALVLQGEADRALGEAEKTAPRYRGYGLRVRGQALTALGDLDGARAALDEAVRIAPGDSAAWTALGRYRMTAGDLQGAIEAAQRAVQLNPDDVDALLLRGELVRTQFGLVASIPWFETALKHDPWRHDALIEYAATLGDVGRTNDMLAAVRRAMQAQPGSPQALYLQAVLAARAGNYDLARGLLDRTGGAIDSLPGVLLLGGILDIDAGGYQQAIEKLQALVGMQPMNITARKLLATALLRSDAARNAIDVLRPVVARSDADSYALQLVGRGFERIGDRATAARFLDRAALPVVGDPAPFSPDDSVAVLGGPAADAPSDPAAIVPYVRALIASGDKARALARAQALEADNPGAPGAHILVGDMLMLLGRTPQAVAAYKRAADLRFDEPVMLRLVDAQEQSGGRADAANTLALFLSQNPLDVAGQRLAAHWQIASGDFGAAIDTLESLRARIGDRDAALNAELAFAYAGAGDEERARDFGAIAYALAPLNPAAADAYGWALYQNGEMDGALELLQKAVALAPRHAGLRWHLAQVYADLGRKPEARAEARAALADPGFLERADAEALIAQLG